MPCDALSYKFLAEELNNILAGGRIEKINMPEPDEVVLSVRAERQTHLLVISAGAYPRLHITSMTKENPPAPPSLCMNLRKNFGGAVIKSISQLPDERVTFIDVTHRDELGVRTDRRLICEIMGKYSNLILAEDGGRIIECLRHIPLDVSAKRQLLPGLKYNLPTQDKLSPLDYDGICTLNMGDDPYGAVLRGVKGLSPASIAEAVFNAQNAADSVTADGNSCGNSCDSRNGSESGSKSGSKSGFAGADGKICGAGLAAAIRDLYNLPLSPCVLIGEKGDFFIRKYNSQCGEYVFFDSLNKAMDFFYAEKDQKNRLGVKSRTLSVIAKNAYKRAEKRLAEFYAKINESMDCESDRITGDLITANIYRITSGMTLLVTPNYYADSDSGDGDGEGGAKEIEIQLDPLLSPAANAQKYYKKYAKKKRTLVAARSMAEKAEQDIAAYAEILFSLQNLTSANEVSDIAEEMAALSLIKSLPRRKGEKPSQPRTAVVDGFRIFAGKNNVQNERLYKTAKGSDIWLHARGYHGSHVVIESDGRQIPDSIILAAAGFAAYYSGGGTSAKTEVDYTLIKHVKKQPAGGPGKVFYTNQKTVLVQPIPMA